MYPSGYMQDTCRIHRNTSGYVSDRKPPQKRIGTPLTPDGGRPKVEPLGPNASHSSQSGVVLVTYGRRVLGFNQALAGL